MHIIQAVLFHFKVDGTRYDIARGQFGARVVRNVIVAEALESLYLYNDLFGLPSTVAYWGSYDAEFMPPVGQDYVRFGALLAIDDRDTF